MAVRLPAIWLPTIPLRTCRIPPRALRLIIRVSLIIGVLIGITVLYLRHACLLGGYPGVYGGSCYRRQNYVSTEVESYVHDVPSPPPSLHVVVSSTWTENMMGKTDWITEGGIASLLALPEASVSIKKYVTDDNKAEYHPRVNKGHEVSVYLTYILDHYDSLPDVVLFIHAEDYAWHVEPLLLGSLAYLLSRLDITQVLSRNFVNLRVSWLDACPDWINTTIPAAQSTKKEEPLMHKAFTDNFSPKGAAHHKAPEILAAPCCNQFAITRAAIRRNKKTQYARHLDWIKGTQLDDAMSGRVWERMFQYLFTGKAVDCPIERKTYCSLYRICLDPEDWSEYKAAEEEDVRLRKSVRNVWSILWRPWWGIGYARRLAVLGDRMRRLRQKGLIQGKHKDFLDAVGDIYAE